MPSHAESRVADFITSHRPGFSLAQHFYADAAVFRAEIEAIWHRQWIFAGMACEGQPTRHVGFAMTSHTRR